MKKNFRITVNGKTYDVVAEVLDEQGGAPASAAPSAPRRRSAAAAAPVAASAPKPAPSSGGGAPGDVLSPLAGKVVSIDAPAGTAVKAGDKVMTLEAMKMNTVVSAPSDGTVNAVHVAPGDSVEESQSLLSIS